MSFGGGLGASASSPTKDELKASIARLDAATERLKDHRGGSPESDILADKLHRFSTQVEDLDKTVDDLCSSISVERELAAAKALREEKAAIRKKMLDEEEAAEKKYNEAIALAKAETEAVEESLRARKIEEAKLDQLRIDLEVRRKARASAELSYSSDLAATIRRLRDLEGELEGTRTSVASAYDRRRLHDALRRIRLSRLSLNEQILDYDYHGRRLATVYDAPSLYTGLASRAYDLYPYYRYTRSYYPYYSGYYPSYYRSYPYYYPTV
mmetsp:Transcript_8447/g.21596  ORF Transcript_8447/g.21596 Transcript_8447/m.21596 type:complete len:269 (-) Transcript_8447:154-960(-)|eukprot:CAMPEP_0182918900 /NCGR_PEP_ID=MMETSP0105_2-20130417/2360_1 /TAXON_ID=81532 ORGANISM="Acanthoeca-like sp., Strain 10tr" /NCGR_SAMPLE_ID=MMETSP0105_2 /ASSEMBLY_ACC=CAM_ASM_000205 /LENGTH=268 /DNA_ID=CAMNT_0025056023 /DNA_START=112 /DNA_END=918 /DNA_ORIENTATION=-